MRPSSASDDASIDNEVIPLSVSDELSIIIGVEVVLVVPSSDESVQIISESD